jgi:hypothetical protein
MTTCPEIAEKREEALQTKGSLQTSPCCFFAAFGCHDRRKCFSVEKKKAFFTMEDEKGTTEC